MFDFNGDGKVDDKEMLTGMFIMDQMGKGGGGLGSSGNNGGCGCFVAMIVMLIFFILVRACAA